MATGTSLTERIISEAQLKVIRFLISIGYGAHQIIKNSEGMLRHSFSYVLSEAILDSLSDIMYETGIENLNDRTDVVFEKYNVHVHKEKPQL